MDPGIVFYFCPLRLHDCLKLLYNTALYPNPTPTTPVRIQMTPTLTIGKSMIIFVTGVPLPPFCYNNLYCVFHNQMHKCHNKYTIDPHPNSGKTGTSAHLLM